MKQKYANEGLSSFQSIITGNIIFTIDKEIQFIAEQIDMIWGCTIYDIINQVIGPTVIPARILSISTDTQIKSLGSKGLSVGFLVYITKNEKLITSSKIIADPPPLTINFFLPYFETKKIERILPRDPDKLMMTGKLFHKAGNVRSVISIPYCTIVGWP